MNIKVLALAFAIVLSICKLGAHNFARNICKQISLGQSYKVFNALSCGVRKLLYFNSSNPSNERPNLHSTMSTNKRNIAFVTILQLPGLVSLFCLILVWPLKSQHTLIFHSHTFYGTRQDHRPTKSAMQIKIKEKKVVILPFPTGHQYPLRPSLAPPTSSRTA